MPIKSPELYSYWINESKRREYVILVSKYAKLDSQIIEMQRKVRGDTVEEIRGHIDHFGFTDAELGFGALPGAIV